MSCIILFVLFRGKGSDDTSGSYGYYSEESTLPSSESIQESTQTSKQITAITDETTESYPSISEGSSSRVSVTDTSSITTSESVPQVTAESNQTTAAITESTTEEYSWELPDF